MQNLNNKINELNSTIEEKNEELKNQKKEYETEIDILVSKFVQYKQKQNEVVNEFNIKKLDYNRESSLLKQQIDFLNKKLQEQVFYNEETDKQHDDNKNELKN